MKLIPVIRVIVCLASVAFPYRFALAQALPVPPCAGPPHPAASEVGESLNQLVWVDDSSLDDWSPPACLGWSPGPTRALLAAAGRFTLNGSTDQLANRIAQISATTGLIYWSSSRKRWRHLFEKAFALSAPDGETSRDDFTAVDIVPGAELFFWMQEDNPVSGVVFQLLIHERTPDRLTFETVNRSSLRARLLLFRPEIAEPGEYRQIYFIERESGSTWLYYSIVRMGRARSFAGTTEANYRNRAEAYFRYLAGVRMDREPPAAP